MDIGLIDVDGHNFPNLALMKLSAYHKDRGDQVEMIKTPLDAKVNLYDKIYKSKVFTFTNDDYNYLNCNNIVKGGTGYKLNNKLPYNIEHIYPDYNLYDFDYAVGYLTRGCPRNCDFCIVSEKEGLKSHKVANLFEFYDGQDKIKLLDPNILASKEKYNLLQQLIDSKAKIDITQGLDIRFMNEKIAKMLNEMNLEMLHFAWDNYEFKTYEKLKKYRSYFNYGKRKLRVYVLVNFNTTIQQDLERIIKLKELNYDPFVMVYDKDKQQMGSIYNKIQRWVNNKFIWYSGSNFIDYLKNCTYVRYKGEKISNNKMIEIVRKWCV